MESKDEEEERLRTAALQNAQSILAARRRAEEALKRQSEWLRITLASIGDAVISTDVEGRVIFLNAVAEILTGWSQHEALGLPLAEIFCIIHQQTRAPVENPALRALRDGVIVGLANHTLLVAKDGTERLIDDSAAPIRDDAGQVVGAVLIFRDVTERTVTEEACARLAAIVESSQDAIISKTLEGTILTWNKGAERLFGYAAGEVIGRSITLIIPPDRLDEEHEILARIARGDRVEHFETVRVGKGGRQIDISLTVSPIRDPADRIIGASKIARDITDRRRLDAALREADKRKDQFIALLAHELRNPLAPLRNGLHVMRQAANNPQAVTEAREIMERQLAHMVRLIDDLLDISRISQNKMELRRTRVLLSDVMSSAVETVRPAIDAAGHHFTISLPPEPIYLDADVTRLAQVFSNLLTNSAKYTESGGRISLSAQQNGGEVVVSVRDTGIGIPSADLTRIFDMFSQVDRSIERTTGGLGIGLALVKGLIEMHEGRVTVASEGPGQGSTFTVALPALVTTAATHVQAPSSAAAQPTDIRQRRILVVDDNHDAADSMALMLRHMGNHVQTAYGGTEAIEKAETFVPDAIFMDIGMPKLNGYDATQQIRERHWGQGMFIVALTGWGQEQDRTRSMEAGCDAHLVKPVSVSNLKDLLAELDNRGSPGK